MIEQSLINIENAHLANVYWKRPLVITKGRGAIVYDIHDNEYIDCTGSYGVALVGHSHPKIVDAINNQAQKIIACHGSFYNDARSTFVHKLSKIVPKGLTKFFLSNSGAESVECAIKLARKFTGKSEIISMVGAYHGKTIGALSATWNKKYRDPFKPLLSGFVHIPRFNIAKLQESVSEKTAAIIIEPIQGESGVIMPPDGFFKELFEFCNEKGVLVIFDEIQTGFGRTGKMFACEHWNVVPDILCLAKSIGGGLPLGLTISRSEVMSAFTLGDHTNTFGGNPVVCAAASAVIDVLLEENLPERANQLGKYFIEQLCLLQKKHKIIRDVRGAGLMIGVELRFNVMNLLLKSMEKGVLILNSGRNILRFLPPLVIEQKQLDRVISVLDHLLGEEEIERFRH